MDTSTAGDRQTRSWRGTWAAPEADGLRTINLAVNLTILAGLGAAALGHALTVDADISRGWTVWETLRNVPSSNWEHYERLLDTDPILAKACISGFVYFLGDLTAQTYEGRGLGDYDRLRMLRSATCGFIAHGPLSHAYYIWIDGLASSIGLEQGRWTTTIAKVAFDQTAWSLFWNSTYYALLGAMKLESPASIVRTVRDTWWPCLSAGWKLWPAAHLLTYSVIPQEHRLLWVDTVEIVWVTLLSYMASKYQAREAGAGSAPRDGCTPGEGMVAQVSLPGPVSGGSAVEELMHAVENQDKVSFVDAEGRETVHEAREVWEHESEQGCAETSRPCKVAS